MTKKELGSLAFVYFFKEPPTGPKPQCVGTVEALISKYPDVLEDKAKAHEEKEVLEALQEEAEAEAAAKEAAEAAGVLELISAPLGPKSEFVEFKWRYKIGEEVEAMFGTLEEPKWFPCVVKKRKNEGLTGFLPDRCDGYRVASLPDTPEDQVWAAWAYPVRGEIRRPGETDVCSAGCRTAGNECKCDDIGRLGKLADICLNLTLTVI